VNMVQANARILLSTCGQLGMSLAMKLESIPH
jgi:hypothetical protein